MAKTQKQFRVIWTLSSGARVYSCDRGEPILWTVKEFTRFVEKNSFGFYLSAGELVKITGYLVQPKSEEINLDWLPDLGIAQ